MRRGIERERKTVPRHKLKKKSGKLRGRRKTGLGGEKRIDNEKREKLRSSRGRICRRHPLVQEVTGMPPHANHTIETTGGAEVPSGVDPLHEKTKVAAKPHHLALAPVLAHLPPPVLAVATTPAHPHGLDLHLLSATEATLVQGALHRHAATAHRQPAHLKAPETVLCALSPGRDGLRLVLYPAPQPVHLLALVLPLAVDQVEMPR